jgi:hypothetical protein
VGIRKANADDIADDILEGKLPTGKKSGEAKSDKGD